MLRDGNAFITGSEVNRWGIGVVQEIDSAAMHLFARWQHLSSISAQRRQIASARHEPADPATTLRKKSTQSFEDLDIFQVGGVIFF